MKLNQPLFVVAAMALAPHAFAQDKPQAPTAPARDTAPAHLLAKADKIVGLNIRDAADKSLGEIGDALVDPRSGEIRYAILEVGGFLGMGEDRRVVPWSYILVGTDEKNVEKLRARTTLTEAQVKAAPTCKGDQVFDADLDRRIEATFGKDDAWAFNGDGKPVFVRLSQMDGVKIKDPAGKEIGSVEDLILAPQNGCIAYAVIDTNKDAGGKHVALPISRLQYAYDADKKVVASTPVELARFQTAPEFDSHDWKRMSGMPWVTEVSTYYSTDPFWKSSRFASARKLPTPKPQNP